MMHAVGFDADETLIDLQPAIVIALDHVVARVRAHDPASTLVREDLEAGWQEVAAAAERCGPPGRGDRQPGRAAGRTAAALTKQLPDHAAEHM